MYIYTPRTLSTGKNWNMDFFVKKRKKNFHIFEKKKFLSHAYTSRLGISILTVPVLVTYALLSMASKIFCIPAIPCGRRPPFLTQLRPFVTSSLLLSSVVSVCFRGSCGGVYLVYREYKKKNQLEHNKLAILYK